MSLSEEVDMILDPTLRELIEQESIAREAAEIARQKREVFEYHRKRIDEKYRCPFRRSDGKKFVCPEPKRYDDPDYLCARHREQVDRNHHNLSSLKDRYQAYLADRPVKKTKAATLPVKTTDASNQTTSSSNNQSKGPTQQSTPRKEQDNIADVTTTLAAASVSTQRNDVCTICNETMLVNQETMGTLVCKHRWHKGCVARFNQERIAAGWKPFNCPDCEIGVCIVCRCNVLPLQDCHITSCSHKFHKECWMLHIESTSGTDTICPKCGGVA